MTNTPARNYRCRHYLACLARGAHANEKELPCPGCPFEHDRGQDQAKLDDLAGIIALLAVIFSPDDRANISATLEAITSNLIFHLALLTGDRPCPWEAEYSFESIFGRKDGS